VLIVLDVVLCLNPVVNWPPLSPTPMVARVIQLEAPLITVDDIIGRSVVVRNALQAC
jgi:hypothetical protein